MALLFTGGGETHQTPGKHPVSNAGPTDWRLLLTAPILMNFVFFLIYAFASFGAATQVTLPNVEGYIADLSARVRSVTAWNCVYKLRRASQLLAPTVDFSWLAEIEKDLALVMDPRSKFDRLVFTPRRSTDHLR